MNDHLTKSQLDLLKQKLQTRQQELRTEIQEALIEAGDEHTAAKVGEVRDEGDESVADLLIDTDYTIIENQARALNQVEQALGRLREGSYGECVECGADIGFERLKVEPAAMRDIECQRRYEKDYQTGASPSL